LEEAKKESKNNQANVTSSKSTTSEEEPGFVTLHEDKRDGGCGFNSGDFFPFPHGICDGDCGDIFYDTQGKLDDDINEFCLFAKTAKTALASLK